MPTYYSTSGFHIAIERPLLSNFTGIIYADGIDFLTLDGRGTITTTTLNVYLVLIKTYTFEFENETDSDPTSFNLRDYDTGDLIAEIIFPLADPLILVVGIDGKSDKNLKIIYPLKTFTFANSSGEVTWACSSIPVDCSFFWEEAITGLPDPKIIGNLTGCGADGYVGDPTQEKTCDSESGADFFWFVITGSDGNNLYSRIECCCPTVVPDDGSGDDVPGFVCTCPDWGRATSYNMTLFNASIRLKNWVTSNAGAKADCKHIMAAKRIMGIDQPIYTDPPYSAPPAPPTPN